MAEIDQYIELYSDSLQNRDRTIRINHDTDYCSGSSKSAIFSLDNGWYTFHCFRCGKRFAKPSGLLQAKSTLKKKTSKRLPSDSNTTIQGKPRSWLRGFLTASEIASSGILWSDSTQRLWFPIRREGIQHGWTGRYFGSDDKPKYSTIVL